MVIHLKESEFVKHIKEKDAQFVTVFLVLTVTIAVIVLKNEIVFNKLTNLKMTSRPRKLYLDNNSFSSVIIIHVSCSSESSLKFAVDCLKNVDNTIIVRASHEEWVSAPSSFTAALSDTVGDTMFLCGKNKETHLTRADEAISTLKEITRRIERARRKRAGRLMVLIGCTPFQLLRTVQCWTMFGKLTREWLTIRSIVSSLCDGLLESDLHMHIEANLIPVQLAYIKQRAKQLSEQAASRRYKRALSLITKDPEDEFDEKEKAEDADDGVITFGSEPLLEPTNHDFSKTDWLVAKRAICVICIVMSGYIINKFK